MVKKPKAVTVVSAAAVKGISTGNAQFNSTTGDNFHKNKNKSGGEGDRSVDNLISPPPVS